MARDLDLTRPAADQIIGVATMREAGGLAMSSRNAYLSAKERAQAALLPQAMREAIATIEGGGDIASALGHLGLKLLEGGFSSVDYVDLCDASSLKPLRKLTGAPARLLVAARIGPARLIDNMAVGGACPEQPAAREIARSSERAER